VGGGGGLGVLDLGVFFFGLGGRFFGLFGGGGWGGGWGGVCVVVFGGFFFVGFFVGLLGWGGGVFLWIIWCCGVGAGCVFDCFVGGGGGGGVWVFLGGGLGCSPHTWKEEEDGYITSGQSAIPVWKRGLGGRSRGAPRVSTLKGGDDRDVLPRSRDAKNILCLLFQKKKSKRQLRA